MRDQSVKILEKRVWADEPRDREELPDAKHAGLQSVVTIADTLHLNCIGINSCIHLLFVGCVIVRLIHNRFNKPLDVAVTIAIIVDLCGHVVLGVACQVNRDGKVHLEI